MTLTAECPRCGWSDIERDPPPLPYPDAMTTAFPAWTFDPYPLCPICTKEQAMAVLSSVIFDLEHKASLLEDRQEKLAALEQDVQESLRARQQLAHLHEYTERILTSGVLISEPLPASGEHPAAPVPPIEPPMDVEPPTPAPEPAPDPVIGEPPAPEPEEAPDQVAEVAPANHPDEPAAPRSSIVRTQVLQDIAAHDDTTGAEVIARLGLPKERVQPTISNLKRDGLIAAQNTLPPFRYRVTMTGRDTLEILERADADPVTVTVELIKPVPVQEAAETAPAITGAPSARARILELFQAHPGQAFTAREVADHLYLPDPAHVAELLSQMSERGAVEFDRDRYGAGLTPPARPFEQAAPAGPAPVQSDPMPIPERLSVDECTVFDTLRKDPAGLTEKVLHARVNWSKARFTRVMTALLERGHIHRVGDRLRAGPAQSKKVA